MPRYLISFDRGWMQFPEEDLPDVARAAHAVMRQAADAGVYVFTGGIDDGEVTTLVQTDGSVGDGPYPKDKAMVGGFAVLDVPTRADAIAWAAKIAAACRCPQEVREFLPDPEFDALMRR